MRVTFVALALISADASASAGELWPTTNGGFRYALTEPVGPGRERFGYVDAEPGRRGWWKVTVTCGIRDSRSGRVIRQVVGKGEGTRGRAAGLGGQFTLPDGRCGSYVVSQDATRPEDLRLPGEFSGVAECPGMGVGDLSSGD